jgi:hypothetical protein
MAHIHNVYDTGKCFEINGISRFIKETSPTKLVLVQGDHNSEIITFKMPRYIDGHDMLLCNKIRVHYINVDTKTNDSSADIYDVTDLALCEDCEDEVTFTWTVEAPATKYAGSLAFVIKFECVEEGNILYQWNTAKYIGINVLAGLDNSEGFVDKYSSVIDKWVNELEESANIKFEEWFDELKESAEFNVQIQNGMSYPDYENSKIIIPREEESYTIDEDGYVFLWVCDQNTPKLPLARLTINGYEVVNEVLKAPKQSDEGLDEIRYTSPLFPVKVGDVVSTEGCGRYAYVQCIFFPLLSSTEEEVSLKDVVDNSVAEYMEKNDIYAKQSAVSDYMQRTDEELRDINTDISQLSKEIENLGGGTYSSIEPSEDDIPKVFFDGDTTGMTKDNEKILNFAYKSKTKQFDGYVKMKWQGSSSLSFPKKNFTIKMFSDETCETKLKKVFKDWEHEGNKYVLKANYIDHTHARNVVTANLWTEIVASRSDYDSLPVELRNSPKNGAIDGFPVKLYLNGKYEGIYTWNIGKDDWMFGVDEDNVNQAVICAEKNNNGNSSTTDRNILACEFRANANIDGNDWDLEVPDVLHDNIKTSFNNLINCVKDTDDETFKATIGNHLDVTSALDYYILMYFSCAVDNLGKNLIMVTYDGVKWYCSAYDLDNIWGSRGTNTFVDGTFKCPEQYQDTNSLLWQRIEKCFANELYERYQVIRKRVLSFSNVIDKFERFCDLIGTELYAEDVTIYSGIPYPTQNNLKQIRNFFKPRADYVDSCFEELVNGSGGTEEPDEPTIDKIACTGITLNTNALEFTNKATQTLTATVEPSNTTDKIVWTSSDTTIATVSNGVVRPIANGDCEITATCGTQSASCSVSVNTVGEPNQVMKLSSNGLSATSWADDIDGSVYRANDCTVENNAMVFNGSSSFVSLNYSPINIASDFKIEFDFTPKNIGNYQVILGNQNAPQGAKNKISIGTPDSTKLFVNVIDSAGTVKIDKITNTVLSNGTTYTCKIEKYGGNIEIYLDDVLMASATDVGFNDTPQFYMGKNGSMPNCYYNGAISRLEAYCFPIEGDDNGLLYSIDEETSFDGTNTYIDTGVKLWSLDIDFTIAIDMTPSTNAIERTVFACTHSSNPYQGIKMSCHPTNNGYYKLTIFNTSEHAIGTNTVIPYDTTKNVKMVITHYEGTELYSMYYMYDGTVYNLENNNTFLANGMSLVIGADGVYNSSSTPVRVFNGTMHDFKIYSKVLTDEEITAYLNS